MQESSVGVTVSYRMAAAASASNCIHALRKDNNIVTMPERDVYFVNGKYTYVVSHSYLLCSCSWRF